jgi:hypothetical protein
LQHVTLACISVIGGIVQAVEDPSRDVRTAYCIAFFASTIYQLFYAGVMFIQPVNHARVDQVDAVLHTVPSPAK